MKLNEYTTLGRTGLRVTPLCFGAMSFGTGWGWGSDERTSHEMIERYLAAGGNFIDTADGYQAGASEEYVGKFVAERGLRGARRFRNGDRECESGDQNAKTSVGHIVLQKLLILLVAGRDI